MNEKELKQQVKDLCAVLNYYIDNVEGSEKYINFIYKISKGSPIIKRNLEAIEGIREIKKRNLTNEYIKKFDSFDIHEALNIEIKEARKKVKNFDFTVKEKNIILKAYQGGSKDFLKEYGEVMN